MTRPSSRLEQIDGQTAENCLVLHGRPLRPGAELKHTSHFADKVWNLSAAQLQRHQNTSRLNFEGIPELYVMPTKHLFYGLLSGELPPGEQRPSIVTVRGLFTHVKSFLTWLGEYSRDGQPPGLALKSLTPNDLDVYRKHLGKTVHPNQTVRSCAAVRYFWRFRSVLPDHLQFDPSREVDDWRVPHRNRETENKTARIPESVLGPLVVWSLRFVDDFAPDILAAQQIWKRAREPRDIGDVQRLRYGAIEDLLDNFVQSGRPLPGHSGRINHKFLSDITGIKRERLQRNPEVLDRIASKVGISERSCFPVDIQGRVDGQPWVESIASHHGEPDSLAVLTRILQTACYVLISFLSGMRDSEVKHLRRGCIETQVDSSGNIYRWKIRSRAFKGEDVDGVEATWVVTATVARAVAVLEALQIYDRDHVFSALPHSPGGQKSAPGRVLSTRATSVQLNHFRDWINDYCARTGIRGEIPLVDGRLWKFCTSQFRRTLAWFIARQPGGSIAGAIQYRHLSIQMFEGYAGTSESGFRAEVEGEAALARGEQLLAAVESHQHSEYLGPAAEEASHRLGEFAEQASYSGTVVTDRHRLTRLMRRHDPAVYPGRYAMCVFNPDKALCTRKTDGDGRRLPTLTDCKPLDCNNVALTAENVRALHAEHESLLKQLRTRRDLPPLLDQRIKGRADAIAEFLARYRG